MSTLVDPNQLKQLLPINSLSPDNLRELSRKTYVETVVTGRYVFKKGDNDKKNIYLLKGELELLDDKTRIKVVDSKSDEALKPLVHTKPRPLSARAVRDSEFIAVDSNLLDIMLTWSQTGTYHVEELHSDSNQQEESDDDWMTQLLNTNAFHKVPPANIQAIFMRMESVEYKAGDAVIEQGDEGEYFYVIKNGRALVTRSTPANPKGIKLAELTSGDSFGEEALISDSKRNATVTMLCKSTLVRLSKNDFISLLNEPIQDLTKFDEAAALVASGKAVWLDVRLPSEYKLSRIKGSQSMPLISMRLKMKTLDKTKKYIICCDTGRRSSAAAFILSEHGYNCIVLENGLQNVPEEQKESG